MYVTPDAEQNLFDIWKYLALDLQVPEIADDYVDRLASDAAKLDHTPYRHERVQDEPWHSRGVRRFLSEAFWIYYTVDDEKGIVWIVNYILVRRYQLKALARHRP